MLSLPIGDNFGKRSIELAGIIVDPTYQQRGVGSEMVQEFVNEHTPQTLTAYTRNPGVLRIMGDVSGRDNVLRHTSPEEVARTLEHASVHEELLYHIDRYGPDGLYGSYDPADRMYHGLPLKQRAVLLQDPNNALAISVSISGDHHE